MDGQDLDRLKGAYGPEFRYHDENLAMLGWYVERMMGALTRSNARTLISLGIGHGVVGRAILSGLAPRLAEYTVVEGSPEAVSAFQASTAVPPNVRVVNALFEEFDPGSAVDAVEMGFVLEHVDGQAAQERRGPAHGDDRPRLDVGRASRLLGGEEVVGDADPHVPDAAVDQGLARRCARVSN